MVVHQSQGTWRIRFRRIGVIAGLVLALSGAYRAADQTTPAPDLKTLAQQSLSKLDGEISIPGLHQPVEVIRDKWGVPHIYAKSVDDLFFAQGYIMGQDRLLQGNPLLERSVRNRFPYLDPLNHVQVELLKEHRAQNPDEQVLRGIQITINGISAGLRNTG